LALGCYGRRTLQAAAGSGGRRGGVSLFSVDVECRQPMSKFRFFVGVQTMKSRKPSKMIDIPTLSKRFDPRHEEHLARSEELALGRLSEEEVYPIKLAVFN
jgi:hypothetical protein